MQLDFSQPVTISLITPQNEFQENVLKFIEEWYSPSVTVSVQTSGSTGIPKIFEVEKEKMQNSAKMTCDFLQIKEGDIALLCLPVQYISGKMMIVRAIERSLKLSVIEPNLYPLDKINTNVDFCAMTPLQVENSLDKLYLIRKLIIGGAAVSESLKKKIKQKLSLVDHHRISTKIYETYGMSETLSHIALKEIYQNAESYFTILEDIEISQDDRNCLRIFAPKLNPSILQTNDIVELKNKNQFRFLGRWDNVINSGGVKIFPEELELLVKKTIPNEVVFIGIPDEKLGQKLALVVEGNENPEIEKRIQQIPFPSKIHQPKEIIFMSRFPRSENGKILRREIINNL